jgi:DNA-binding MarR family transcriptional regulator
MEGGRRVDRENLGFLLAKAAQRWNELLYDRFRREGYADVRPSYGSILVPLFEEDGLRMGELARRARLSKQTMTTMVALMERNGLVRRGRDETDRRAIRVWLTERSGQFRPVAADVLAELDALVRTRLSAEETKRLSKLLKGVMSLAVENGDRGPAGAEARGLRLPVAGGESAFLGDGVRSRAQGRRRQAQGGERPR